MIMAELKLSPTVKKQQAQVEQRRTNSVIGHFLGSRDQRRGEGKSRTIDRTIPKLLVIIQNIGISN